MLIRKGKYYCTRCDRDFNAPETKIVYVKLRKRVCPKCGKRLAKMRGIRSEPEQDYGGA